MSTDAWSPTNRPAKQQGAQHPRRWTPEMKCSICGEYIRQYQAFNYDHVVPISLGGRRGKVNKQPAHYLCNAVKGNRYPFYLRTPAEREKLRARVSSRTWINLVLTWAGHPYG